MYKCVNVTQLRISNRIIDYTVRRSDPPHTETTQFLDASVCFQVALLGILVRRIAAWTCLYNFHFAARTLLLNRSHSMGTALPVPGRRLSLDSTHSVSSPNTGATGQRGTPSANKAALYREIPALSGGGGSRGCSGGGGSCSRAAAAAAALVEEAAAAGRRQLQ